MLYFLTLSDQFLLFSILSCLCPIHYYVTKGCMAKAAENVQITLWELAIICLISGKCFIVWNVSNAKSNDFILW